VEETGVQEENHRPDASHWQSFSLNVVSSTPHHEQDSNQTDCMVRYNNCDHDNRSITNSNFFNK
jgi:hypothetical protein